MTEAERIERAARAYREVTFNALTLDECRDAARAAITAYLGGDVVVPREPTPSFKEGDRVHHTGINEDGTVTSVANGVVTVEFDIRTSRGNISVGAYDENWFKTHPGWLLSAAAAAEMEG